MPISGHRVVAKGNKTPKCCNWNPLLFNHFHSNRFRIFFRFIHYGSKVTDSCQTDIQTGRLFLEDLCLRFFSNDRLVCDFLHELQFGRRHFVQRAGFDDNFTANGNQRWVVQFRNRVALANFNSVNSCLISLHSRIILFISTNMSFFFASTSDICTICSISGCFKSAIEAFSEIVELLSFSGESSLESALVSSGSTFCASPSSLAAESKTSSDAWLLSMFSSVSLSFDLPEPITQISISKLITCNSIEHNCKATTNWMCNLQVKYEFRRLDGWPLAGVCVLRFSEQIVLRHKSEWQFQQHPAKSRPSWTDKKLPANVNSLLNPI